MKLWSRNVKHFHSLLCISISTMMERGLVATARVPHCWVPSGPCEVSSEQKWTPSAVPDSLSRPSSPLPAHQSSLPKQTSWAIGGGFSPSSPLYVWLSNSGKHLAEFSRSRHGLSTMNRFCRVHRNQLFGFPVAIGPLSWNNEPLKRGKWVFVDL